MEDGVYVLKGVYLHEPGNWVFDFAVKVGSVREIASYRFYVEG